jgi:hypothetical protein
VSLSHKPIAVISTDGVKLSTALCQTTTSLADQNKAGPNEETSPADCRKGFMRQAQVFGKP